MTMGWMMSKQKFWAVMFFLPMLVATAKADAVPVSASFAFSIDSMMEHFFASNPTMIIDGYMNSEMGSEDPPLPLPGGAISIDEDHQTTTPLLQLGNVAPGATFSIRFTGEYFATNRTPGLPPVPVRARIRLDLRLLEPRPGTYQVQLVTVSGRNEYHPVPQAGHMRAIESWLTGGVQGAGTINLGGRLRIGLDFGARGPLPPSLLNQIL
jgi:hypothetical protein